MPIKVTPKDFFLWLGAMLALYGSAVAFISLLFEYINYAYPDTLTPNYIDPYSTSIRFEMATLIVLVPVTLILMRLIRKDIMRVPEKSELWVRRWALVLTVFVAGTSIVGDLITLINYFLGGDLTVRFAMKVAIVLLVGVALFLHFISDLWGYWIQYPARARSVGWGAGIAVLFSIVAGFFIMGTPGQVRLMRFDAQKIGDMQSIQWQVVNYWQQKEKLPARLSDLQDPIAGYVLPRDPQTGELYEYKIQSSTSFTICAVFNLQGGTDQAHQMSPITTYPGGGGLENDLWLHESGRTCFIRKIDAERYPPFPKIPKNPQARVVQ